LYMQYTHARPGQAVELDHDSEKERNHQRRLRRTEEHIARVACEHEARLQSIAKDRESVKIV
jgi:hypothetical protein